MFGFGKKNKMQKKLSMKNYFKGYNHNNNNYSNIINDNKMLQEGDSGREVERLQNMLIDIVHIYPTLPIVTVNGIFGSETANAIEKFQGLMGINQTGMVDSITWERLRLIHGKRDSIKGIEKIDFKCTSRSFDFVPETIKEGSRGKYVFKLQEYLRKVSIKNSDIPRLTLDGNFGQETKDAVIVFQKDFGLVPDGVVGEDTWNILHNEYIK